MTTASDRWRPVLLGLLIGHIAWGVARIAPRVYGKRLDEIRAYRAKGEPAFHLDTPHQSGADAIESVLAQTSEDAVVLWSGDSDGALEFAPALIAPRLLVAADAYVEGTTTMFGRPVATGRLADGRSGVLVLVGHGHRVELAAR